MTGTGKRYCIICGNTHHPELSCFSAGDEVLRAAGIEGRRHAPAREFKTAARMADRWFIRLMLIIAAVLAVIMILSTVLAKKVF